jgi:hypothetical protein
VTTSEAKDKERTVSRRLKVLLMSVAVAVAMLALAGMASAQDVGTTSSPVINATPDDTWMTNGRVYSVVRYGDHVYVGGKFTRVRSAPSGGTSVVATNLARFDASTGVADKNWRPDVTGSDMTITNVYDLAVAGDKIWVGGRFQAVEGVARRNIAAVSPLTGEVDPNVDSLVGSETSQGIKSMVASDTKVYVGGGFGSVDGKGRNNLAAFDAATGDLDATWKPKTRGSVRGIGLDCNDATVFAGGSFSEAAGPDAVYSPRQSVARFDATSGSLHPWATPAGVVKAGEVAADFAVTCDRVTVPYLGPNLTRSFRLDDGDNGTLVWQKKSGGDVQTVAMLGPDKLVIGGHFGQYDGAQRSGLALINLSDGSVDPSWAPKVEGNFVSVWETFVDGNHIYIGGSFQTVAGLPRTYLTRFTFTA